MGAAKQIEPSAVQVANGCLYPRLFWGVDLALTHSAMVGVDGNGKVKRFLFSTRDKSLAEQHSDKAFFLYARKEFADYRCHHGLPYARMHRLRRNIMFFDWAVPQLEGNTKQIAVEGYTYASATGAYDIGEIGGIFRDRLNALNLPLVQVNPVRLKQRATGNGNAGKGQVIEAAKKLGFDPSELIEMNNQAANDTIGDLADAFVLALMAREHDVAQKNGTATAAEVVLP